MRQLSPHDTLNRIQTLLSQGTPPARLITGMLPRSRDEAIGWARRLPGWDEERGRYPDQAIAIARLISRQAMRTFRLNLSEDGQVIERPDAGGRRPPPEPPQQFRLALGDEEIIVAYTRGYLPNAGTDHFSFESPHDPPQPHALSGTGYWSHFAWHDAVEAIGGPRAYAAQYADARLRGEENAFSATFEGAPPESKPPRRQKTTSPEAPPMPVPHAVLGEHTAGVIAEREPDPLPKPPAHQRRLF
jgi:hypothetical protein